MWVKMAKLEKSLFVVCIFGFSLCFCTVVTNSSSSDEEDSKNPADYLRGICKYFEALEKRNRELEKSHEELKKQFKALSQSQDELRSNISADHGVWLLTPPLTLKHPKQPSSQDKSSQNEASTLSARPLTTSCKDAMKTQSVTGKRKWAIYPYENSSSLQVVCDFDVDVDGGGWTIFQKRSSGPREEFNRTWSEYVNGFGSLDGNFWLGLENIRTLTKNRDQELRIELEDFQGTKAFAKYSNFSISDVSDFYRLSIGGFSGSAGDSIAGSVDAVALNGMRFTTGDKDNDKLGDGNCGRKYPGGWWFNNCGASSHLNGLYREREETFTMGQGIHWYKWKAWEISQAKTEMKIRKRQ